MKIKNKPIRNKKGFTLVELVISVCVMAIISVFMLQFFIGAKDLNRRAGDLDASVYMANSIMESIKSEAWDSSPFLKALSPPNAEGDAFTAQLDDSMGFVKDSGKAHLFNVSVEIKSTGKTTDDKGLYTVLIEVQRLKPYFRGKSQQPIVYSLEATLFTHTIEGVTFK